MLHNTTSGTLNDTLYQQVAQFTAVDEDSGQNAELTYAIVSSLPDAHFRIDGKFGRANTFTTA